MEPLTIKNTYQIVEQIGKGGFGIVYKAIDTSNNNQPVAIKVQSYQKINKSEALSKQFKREIHALQQINNVNVVKLIEVFYINKNDICIVLEYCNQKDLSYYLKQKQNGYLEEEEAIKLFKQLLNAFKALREQSIIHRDIKLENIFLHDGQVKLGDFGLCRQLDEEIQRAGTFLGTYTTMAPEVLNKNNYNSKADIYSLGIILYQIVYGQLPFNASSKFDLMNKQRKMKINFNLNFRQISNQLQSLLEGMLQYDSELRINWQDIYKHPALDFKLTVSQVEEILDNQNEQFGNDLELENQNLNRNTLNFKDFENFKQVLILNKNLKAQSKEQDIDSIDNILEAINMKQDEITEQYENYLELINEIKELFEDQNMLNIEKQIIEELNLQKIDLECRSESLKDQQFLSKNYFLPVENIQTNINIEISNIYQTQNLQELVKLRDHYLIKFYVKLNQDIINKTFQEEKQKSKGFFSFFTKSSSQKQIQQDQTEKQINKIYTDKKMSEAEKNKKVNEILKIQENQQQQNLQQEAYKKGYQLQINYQQILSQQPYFQSYFNKVNKKFVDYKFPNFMSQQQQMQALYSMNQMLQILSILNINFVNNIEILNCNKLTNIIYQEIQFYIQNIYQNKKSQNQIIEEICQSWNVNSQNN